MKVAVAGLWHLGSVTAACLASATHEVVGYDPDVNTIAQLNLHKAPVFEPGLDTLIENGVKQKRLHFSSDRQSVSSAEIVWITFDTPVDENDVADIASVEREISALFPYLVSDAIVLISSQLPVGTTRKLLNLCSQQCPQKNITFACSPENLRLGKAIDVFTKPDRVIVGIQTDHDKERIQRLFQPFTDNIIWMLIESAEMTKHALNAFLATSVVFINELSTLCEKVGADAREVEQGLKSEERIGPKAYLRPGGAIAGGTLARDVNYLIQAGQQQQVTTPLFSALLASNQAHKQWSCRRILDVLKTLQDKTIATLGLTYKAGTDTLRRSSAIEMCEWLSQQGAKISAYDPSLKELPEQLGKFIYLKDNITDTLKGADAVVIATEWPQFTTLTPQQILDTVNQALVFDASGYLLKILSNDQRIRYFSVGRQS